MALIMMAWAATTRKFTSWQIKFSSYHTKNTIPGCSCCVYIPGYVIVVIK